MNEYSEMMGGGRRGSSALRPPRKGHLDTVLLIYIIEYFLQNIFMPSWQIRCNSCKLDSGNLSVLVESHHRRKFPNCNKRSSFPHVIAPCISSPSHSLPTLFSSLSSSPALNLPNFFWHFSIHSRKKTNTFLMQ